MRKYLRISVFFFVTFLVFAFFPRSRKRFGVNRQFWNAAARGGFLAAIRMVRIDSYDTCEADDK